MNNEEFTLKKLIKMFWTDRKFIIVFVMTLSILTVVYSLFMPNWFKATSVIIPEDISGSSLGNLTANLGLFGLGGFNETSNISNKLIAILKSRKLMEDLDHRFDFQRKYETKYNFKTYKKIRSNMYYEVGEEGQITISFWDTDQDLVADVVNYIVDYIDSLSVSMSVQTAQQNRSFIEERYNIAVDSLEYYQTKMLNFMQKNKIIEVSNQIEHSVQGAAELKAQITAKEIEIEILEKRTHSENPAVIFAKNELDILKNKYNQLFFEGNDDLYFDLSNINSLEIDYLNLKREIEYYVTLMEFLGPQFENARIEESRDTPNIQKIDIAQRPEKKDRPRRARIVIVAGIVFFIIGLYISYFRNKKA